MKKYKYTNAHEWFKSFINKKAAFRGSEWPTSLVDIVLLLADLFDNCELEDIFYNEMESGGYFEEEK